LKASPSGNSRVSIDLPNRNQQGLSLIKLVLLLAVLGSITLVGLQVMPLYYDNSVISQIVDETAEASNKKRMGRKQMWQTISKHLQLNNIGYLKQEDVSFEQGEGGETIIAVDYEERRPLVGNMSLVVSFSHKTGG